MEKSNENAFRPSPAKARWLGNCPNLRRVIAGFGFLLFGAILMESMPTPIIRDSNAVQAGVIVTGFIFRPIGLILVWGGIGLAIVGHFKRRANSRACPPPSTPATKC